MADSFFLKSNIRMGWHAKNIKETLRILDVSEDGLSEVEAEKRLRKYGPNVIPKKRRLGPLVTRYF